MPLGRAGISLLLLLPIVCFAQVDPLGCRSYEPAFVELHGRLVRKTFAGPPNYSDIRKGDQPETYWLLKLDSPICVNEDKAAPDLNLAQKNVRSVELVLDRGAYDKFKTLLGKRVVAAGSLFGGFTGHHNTLVLLKVTNLEQAHWK